MRRIAVRQQQAGLAHLAPGQHFDLGAQGGDEAALRLLGDRVGKPLGRVRLLALEWRKRSLYLGRQSPWLRMDRAIIIADRRAFFDCWIQRHVLAPHFPLARLAHD